MLNCENKWIGSGNIWRWIYFFSSLSCKRNFCVLWPFQKNLRRGEWIFNKYQGNGSSSLRFINWEERKLIKIPSHLQSYDVFISRNIMKRVLLLLLRPSNDSSFTLSIVNAPVLMITALKDSFDLRRKINYNFVEKHFKAWN